MSEISVRVSLSKNRSGRGFFLWLLAKRQYSSLTFFHRHMTFEDGTVTDHQTLCGDVAHDRTRWLHFEFLFSRYIRHDFSLHENRRSRDFSFHGCLLSNRNMRLGNNLAFDFAIDGGLPVEMQLAINFRAGSEIR